MKRPPAVAANLNSDRKNVLMVVASGPKRNLRANVFRKHGIEVVCANQISDARLLWHPGSYDLVIFESRQDPAEAIELCDLMRETSPEQRIAFLVGKPEYLAASPGAFGTDEPPRRYEETLRQLMSTACDALPRRGGFLEATWRMSLTRSVVPAQVQVASVPPVVHAVHDQTAAAPVSFGEAIRREERAQEVIAEAAAR